MSATQVNGLCGIAVPPRDDNESGPQTPNGVSHAVVVSSNTLWENGKVLDYSFFGGTQSQRNKVVKVIPEWSWYANITFSKSTDNNAQATLRITFDPKKGSWSYVGNTAKKCVGPAPTINLGWILDNDTLSKKERGVILHEFGHVLGLMHEHESPARSGVLRLKEKEIIQYYAKTQGWDETTIRTQVLNAYSQDSVSNYSQFDPTSIMMYFMPAAMNEGGVDIHEATELSMLDKAFIVANYPRGRPHACASQWTPAFALVAAGAQTDTIEAYNATTDVDEKRAIFTRDMLDRRALDSKPAARSSEAKPHGQTAVQHTPLVQRGFNTSSEPSQHGDDQFIQNIIKQLDFVGPKPILKKELANQSYEIQNAPNAFAHAEMVQNGILDMLFKVAPLVLFAPNNPGVAPGAPYFTSNNPGVAPGAPYVARAVMDPRNIRLEDPAVQHGLRNFFTQLASNETVKKLMAGAVKVAGHVVSDVTEVVNQFLPQHALDSSESSSSLETSDIQNGLLTDGLGVIVRKVIGHKIFQDAIKEISGLASAQNNVQHLGFVSSASTANPPYGPQNTIQATSHAEEVQNGMLTLLLDIAPKTLLAPNLPAPGSSGVAHAVLDPKNLSFEHPVVQHGLSNFFAKLASNDIVKKVMAGAVEAAKLAKNLAVAALDDLVPQHALNTSIVDPQNGILTDGLAALVKKVVDHKLFKDAIQHIRTAVIQNAPYNDTVFESLNEGELAFRRRMNTAFSNIVQRGGPQARERILQQMEQLLVTSA